GNYPKELVSLKNPLAPVMEYKNPTFQVWDWAKYADDWQTAGNNAPANFMGTPIYPFFYMPSEPRPINLGPFLYATTDPRLADSDGDSMDDYYEMFHGLNPILSDVIDSCRNAHPDGETYDFRAYPWMAGMPNADPDGDDMPNWEEALAPNQPAPANHNTDPSPLWMTDMSYARSFVNLYYNWGSAENFWTVESLNSADPLYYQYPDVAFMQGAARPSYMFSFESTEGFDTDNDNVSDTYEISGSSGGVTDAINPDRPRGRKALYLNGNAAARTRSICAFGPNALRSFTLEAWVMPEEPASGSTQVILERPVFWSESNTEPTYSFVRRNFRLGLTTSGLPFVEFDNGGKKLITERAQARDGAALQAGRWYHLAAVMDGFQNKLNLYVDGERVASKDTSEVPYTGFTTSTLYPVGSSEYHNPDWAPIVLGAADANPYGKVDGSYFYYNGVAADISGGQPQLSNYFKGWIDEVRIWDGARPGGEDPTDLRVSKWNWPTIRDDYDSLKRYGMDETLAARNEELAQLARLVAYRHYTAGA
ncbi:MAG: LamG domain-containing protein, partial [Kiritimatiellae bacterium]|nr:LamG domain-containing protein [Kiritimatiellia bacterium]